MHQKQLQTLLPCQRWLLPDGIIFHRIIPEFYDSGGDPTGTAGMGGQSIWR